MNNTIYAYACTDIGPERAVNQDTFTIARDLKLYMVADGMGGYLGGDVASHMAVTVVERELRASKPAGVREIGEVLARGPSSRVQGNIRACAIGRGVSANGHDGDGPVRDHGRSAHGGPRTRR